MQGKIIKGIAGFYYVYAEDGATYECRAKGIFRKDKRKPLVGDEVEISVLDEREAEGNVDELLPRRSSLIRPAVANADQALVVASIRDPEPHPLLIDRFFAIMARQGLEAALCLNKADLAGEEELEDFAAPYRGTFPVFVISAGEGRGLGELRDYLAGKTTVMAGPSGVGKSTLTNSLQGEIRMETGEISQKLGRGRHTTRHSQIIPLGRQTFLVDTPGFTSLELPKMEIWELAGLYPEFAPFLEGCYYKPCLHEHEPQCGVKEALKMGKVHQRRYENYLALLEEVRGQRRY